jgi:hypothetical protein
VSQEEDKPVEMESNESDQVNNNQENDLAGLDNDGDGGAQIVNEEEEQLDGELDDIPPYMVQEDEQPEEEVPEVKEE